MPAEQVKRAVAVQEENRASVLASTRRLIELRKAYSAIRSGRFVALDLPAPLMGFERVDGGQRIRCLFNLGHRAKRCRMVEEGRLLFASGAVDQAKGAMGGLAACWLEL